MDELCVVVKKAPRIPAVLLPLVIFDANLWLNLFFAGILIGIVWSLIRCMNNIMRRPLDMPDKIQFYVDSYDFSRFLAHQSQLRQYAQVFVDTWLLFLSIPMRRFTRVQNERIFVASICMTSIVFVSMYQSGLATVFVRPLYFKDITTLAQLDAHGDVIKVKYAGYLTDVFPDDSSDTFRSLRKKMQLVDTEMAAMDLVKENSYVATITRKSTVLLDNSVYFMKKQLHLIDKECPKNYFLAFMVPVNSVYLEKINEILFDIQRFGLIKKWINEINFEATLANMKSVDYESSAAKVLSLDDLKFPFLVLIGGNSLGIVIIVVELLIGCVKAMRKRFKYIATKEQRDVLKQSSVVKPNREVN
jgi:hypothetical protein